MHHHRLVVSYKGTHYFGWQELGAGDRKPTVQASLDRILKKICKYKSCTISAASRTDSGVHAQGQVVKLTIPIAIDSGKLLLGMNSLLADDIRVLRCEPCTAAFNPNMDSSSKEYHYYFCADPVHNPVLNDFVAHISSKNKASATGPLDIELMQRACRLFVGEHDFYRFARRDITIGSTCRTIFSCEILPAQASNFGNKIYCLKVVGNGFLRHMIRYIAGALFALGKSQLSPGDISEALLNRKEEKICPRAKSRGLHLIRVNY